MLKLLKTNNNLQNYNPCPIGDFEPGLIGQLYYGPMGAQMVGVSDGTNPLGILNDTRNISVNTLNNSLINVYLEIELAETDIYETYFFYRKGDELFASHRGRFTPENDFETPPLAIVVEPPNAYNQILKFEMLPEKLTAPISVKKSSGMACSSCKDFNIYADGPNQADGTYRCYHCRQRNWP